MSEGMFAFWVIASVVSIVVSIAAWCIPVYLLWRILQEVSQLSDVVSALDRLAPPEAQLAPDFKAKDEEKALAYLESIPKASRLRD